MVLILPNQRTDPALIDYVQLGITL
jgi:hypothetical protein